MEKGDHTLELRRAYGFEEVALVPGSRTVDPDDVDTSWSLEGLSFSIPFLASAMDGVVDPAFAIAIGKLGGLAVLNLEGIHTRYENAREVYEEIVKASPQEVTRVMQGIYQQPIKPNLVGERIQEIKRAGVKTAVSCTPLTAPRLAPLAVEAGVDVLFVQATVTSAIHVSSRQTSLDFTDFCKRMQVPVVIGNCVTYQAAKELMEVGAAALLIGIGPGAACTSREVLGVGVPQVTATMSCAAARDDFYATTGRYVPIITDGGMRTGGDICKAIASGSDAVMIGSPFAQAEEAPGCGYHWGMATPHAELPRGTRIKVGVNGSLREILMGPTSRTDGTQNLLGALKTSMGVCGAMNLKEMQRTEMVIAPSIKTEGKVWQLAGQV